MEKMENFLPLKITRKAWLSKIIKHAKTSYGLALILILAVASFMRLYKISEYMTFLGDEGRDAIIAREILNGNLTLLGPRASAGDFFLGPVYYYMIAPFLALFRYDPVGPAVMVALLGVGTVFLVFYFTQKFFGRLAGLIAASLYALSPIVIAFSRSSWNPNPVPFFVLLLVFSLYFGVKRNSLKLFLASGVLLGILLQLHYIAVFIGIIIILFVLIGNFILGTENIIKRYALQYLSIFSGFIFGLSPFLVFELKHGFPNIKTIVGFIFIDNFHVERVRELTHFEIVQDVLFRLYARLVINFPPPEQISMFSELNIQLLQIFVLILILSSIGALFFTKNKLLVVLLSVWLFVGIFLFGFYKKEIYDYYYGFLFPLPFILIGNMISLLIRAKGRLRLTGIVVGVVLLSVLLYMVVSNNPFKYPGNKQKNEAENIANVIIEVSRGKPYNFALVTSGNSDHVFRYFLEIKNKAPIVIENLEIDPGRESVMDQLIVVCDNACQPLGNSLWEIAGFGRARIINELQIPFVKIYRLVHVEADN